MSKCLKIGVDVDEVVADFISAFRKEAEEVLQRPFPNFTHTWAFDNWEFQPGEKEKVWDSIYSTENWFYMNVDPLPEVVRCITWLTSDHDVFFVTSRPQTAGFSMKRQTEMQLSDYGVCYPTVIVESDKGPVAAALKLDAFVDDRPENLLRIQECSPGTRIFLMDQMHNAEFKQPDSWTRVGSFRTFTQSIEEFSER